MDFLYAFLQLILLLLLAYTLCRLYYVRRAGGLVMAAVQFAVIAFMLFSYGDGLYAEPLVAALAVLLGVAAPCVFLAADFMRLRDKIKRRTALRLSQFLYQDDMDEIAKIVKKEKFIDGILRPRAGNFPIEDILKEIRVERADTSKNIYRQLESASKKYEEDNFDGAYDTYQLIEKIFNRSPSLYFNMGNLCYLRGDFDGAARCYRRAAECAGYRDFENDELGEKLGLIYYNLGNACFMAKKYAKSIEAYARAIDEYPANEDAYFNLSFCHAMDYEDTGNLDEASKAFRALVEDMPENLHAWFHFGKCLLKMGETDQAIDCFLKIVVEDTTFYEGWYRLAIAYDERGLPDDAIRAYYTAIQIKPDFIDAHNNLGVLLSTLGRHAEAIKVLGGARRIDPSDTEIV
ncbi:MAG: tetratricopeptide repeat protein, partial [Clostridiales bacterium]|nr:tetratricopeptide repeat protein [Clostridiales bacterium]